LSKFSKLPASNLLLTNSCPDKTLFLVFENAVVGLIPQANKIEPVVLQKSLLFINYRIKIMYIFQGFFLHKNLG